MRFMTMAAMVTFMPALLAAQQAETRTSARADASAETRVEGLPAGLTAETRARLETMVQAAAARNLPTQPLLLTMAEGSAKGASEAVIIQRTGETLTRLETAYEALVRAGRPSPAESEVANGAKVLAHGATSAQLEAVIRKAPPERSLIVAFDVLSELSAKGLPVDQALIQVGGRLEAGAPDVELRSLPVGIGIGRRNP